VEWQSGLKDLCPAWFLTPAATSRVLTRSLLVASPCCVTCFLCEMAVPVGQPLFFFQGEVWWSQHLVLEQFLFVFQRGSKDVPTKILVCAWDGVLPGSGFIDGIVADL